MKEYILNSNTEVFMEHSLPDGRVLIGMKTPEELDGFTLAQASTHVRGGTFVHKGKKFSILGFEMMGYPDNPVGQRIGLLIKEIEEDKEKS